MAPLGTFILPIQPPRAAMQRISEHFTLSILEKKKKVINFTRFNALERTIIATTDRCWSRTLADANKLFGFGYIQTIKELYMDELYWAKDTIREKNSNLYTFEMKNNLSYLSGGK